MRLRLRSERERASSSSGAILLEVLLAVGLLGVVIACLLTAFQGSRRVESSLRAGLTEIGDTQRLIETLRADLRDAEAIAIGGESGSWLRLYPARSDTERYLEYARGREIQGGEESGRGDELRRGRIDGRDSQASRMLTGRRVEFSLLAPDEVEAAEPDSLAQLPGEAEIQDAEPIVGAPRWAKTIRMRLLPPVPVPGDSSAVREYRVELPLALPVLTPQELGS